MSRRRAGDCERTDIATERVTADPAKAVLVLVDCLIWLRNTVAPEDALGRRVLTDVEQLLDWAPEPTKGANQRGPRT